MSSSTENHQDESIEDIVKLLKHYKDNDNFVRLNINYFDDPEDVLKATEFKPYDPTLTHWRPSDNRNINTVEELQEWPELNKDFCDHFTKIVNDEVVYNDECECQHQLKEDLVQYSHSMVKNSRCVKVKKKIKKRKFNDKNFKKNQKKSWDDVVPIVDDTNDDHEEAILHNFAKTIKISRKMGRNKSKSHHVKYLS